MTTELNNKQLDLFDKTNNTNVPPAADHLCHGAELFSIVLICVMDLRYIVDLLLIFYSWFR